MPFIAQQDEENQQNLTGQSSVIGTAAPAGAKAPKSSGTFTNINKYLEANKPQAAQMGQQVAGSVEQAAQQAQQSTEAFKAGAGPQVQAQTQEQVRAQLAAPTQNVQQYQQMRQTGGYTGPQSAEQTQGYQQAQKASQEAAQKVGQLNTEAGRMGLVEQQYARPQYTTGQKRLDTSLVSRNADARGALEQTGQKWAGINNLFSGAAQQVGQQIAQNQAQAAANRNLIAQTEKQYIDETRAALNKQAEDFNRAQTELQNRFMDSAVNRQFTQEDLAALGLEAGTQLYGADLNRYFTPGTMNALAGDVATPEQRQNWQNLMNLVGGTEQLSGGQAGKARVDVEGLKKDIESRRADAMKRAAETRLGKTQVPGMQVLGDYGTAADFINSGASPVDYLREKAKAELQQIGPEAVNNMLNLGLDPDQTASKQYGGAKTYEDALKYINSDKFGKEGFFGAQRDNLAQQVDKFKTENKFGDILKILGNNYKGV